jgi:hypothetical protein
MIKHLLGSIALGVSVLFGIAQAETIETDSLSISLPKNWKPHISSNPVSATGPNGELLQFSFKVVTGIRSAAEALFVLEEVERNAATAMLHGAADPDLETILPLSKRQLENGTVIQELISNTKDGKHTLAQFSVRGSRSLIFATYEASVNDKELRQIRNILENIKWK